MNILVPDNWLRDYLITKATSKQIAEYLSLCGPSVEKTEQTKYGPLYSIEVTSNRIDCASIYGIAREAAAILPRFGLKAKLQSTKVNRLNFTQKVSYLNVSVNHQLCSRFTAVLIKNVKVDQSPNWLCQRLEAVGSRPINNVVDISNYIMHDLGQPLHTFDYDKILNHKMILRESKKGEKITTLDGKNQLLPGGDIVIEDGSGRLIDLAGIMGGENSAIDSSTRNVLLFVQTYNPVNIRRTSMALAHRTEAAVLFEKGIDEELVPLGLQKSIALFQKLTAGIPEKEIIDLYPKPFKSKRITTSFDFINQKIGLTIDRKIITRILTDLNFAVKQQGNSFEIKVPSYRDKDINLPEDIVEEIARLYGYQQLPSQVMFGPIPDQLPNSPFDFENKIKRILKGYGGIEVYTLSLVSKEMADKTALRLKNPLGSESEYLRTSLQPSLVQAVKENAGRENPFHLFEMANIYLPRKDDLPEEKMILAGVFANISFARAKGVIEALGQELNLSLTYGIEDTQNFLPNRGLNIKTGKDNLGLFGVLENNLIYYEFEVEKLRQNSRQNKAFQLPADFPAQVEDITMSFPEKTYLGPVLDSIRAEKDIVKVNLVDKYKNSYSFRLHYQHPSKTLTNSEVEIIRKDILKKIQTNFGGIQKT